MKKKSATYVVVVDGGKANIAEIGERMATLLARDLNDAGLISAEDAVHVSPVRRKGYKRKTPFPKETALPADA